MQIIVPPSQLLPGQGESVAHAIAFHSPEGWHLRDGFDAAEIQSQIESYDPTAHVIATKLADAAAARWSAATGGHTAGADIPVATDDASRFKLAELTVTAAAAPEGTVFSFKDRDGAFHTMSGADIMALHAD